MKYFLFEGGDILGPFSARELWRREGFGASSLVCPEEHSAEESYWKSAQTYESLMQAANQPDEDPAETAESAAASDTDLPRAEKLVQQVNNTVGELKSLDTLDPEVLTTPVDQFVEASPHVKPMPPTEQTLPTLPEVDPQVQTQTVGQPSPIEEYFNTMRTGDLGNILGMPDPKATSDMNLTAVLEKQFEKTDPMTGKSPLSQGEDPFDEFTKDTPKQAQSIEAITPDEADQATQAKLQHEPTAVPAKNTPEKEHLSVQPRVHKHPDTKPTTLNTAVEKLLEADKSAPSKDTDIPAIKMAAQLDKQTVPLSVGQTSHRAGWLGALIASILVCLGMIGIWLYYAQHAVKAKATHLAQTQPAVAVAEPSPAPTGTHTAPSVAVGAPAKNLPTAGKKQAALIQTPEETAIEIVQNHVLDASRGTVENFLMKRYAKELASGYAAAWSAEPLHKQVYVVKYRLAKTRQEPIVYIFQADTSKKKLTGALNNITLDLVGKIK